MKYLLRVQWEYETDASQKRKTPGWADVEVIRKAAGTSIPLAVIEATPRRFAPYEADCTVLEVPEETAVMCDCFKEEGTAQVTVQFFPQAEACWTLAPELFRDQHTGEVDRARMRWRLDKEKFLALWEVSGFPERLKGGDQE